MAGHYYNERGELLNMKEYIKPHSECINTAKNGIIPAALGAAALSVGGAFAVGVAAGLMKDKGIEDNLRVIALKPVMN